MLWPRPPAASVWDSLCKDFYVPVFFPLWGWRGALGAGPRRACILYPMSYILYKLTIYHGPGPGSIIWDSLCKEFNVSVFFPLWGWRGAGAAQGPEAGKGRKPQVGGREMQKWVKMRQETSGYNKVLDTFSQQNILDHFQNPWLARGTFQLFVNFSNCQKFPENYFPESSGRQPFWNF